MLVFHGAVEFVWDQGNRQKNFAKHRVTDAECEEVFFDPDKKIFNDRLHSGTEARYILLGRTKFQRLLFVVFTLRDNRVRVISARDCNRKEKPLYAQAATSHSEV